MLNCYFGQRNLFTVANLLVDAVKQLVLARRYDAANQGKGLALGYPFRCLVMPIKFPGIGMKLLGQEDRLLMFESKCKSKSRGSRRSLLG